MSRFPIELQNKGTNKKTVGLFIAHLKTCTSLKFPQKN